MPHLRIRQCFYFIFFLPSHFNSSNLIRIHLFFHEFLFLLYSFSFEPAKPLRYDRSLCSFLFLYLPFGCHLSILFFKTLSFLISLSIVFSSNPFLFHFVIENSYFFSLSRSKRVGKKTSRYLNTTGAESSDLTRLGVGGRVPFFSRSKYIRAELLLFSLNNSNKIFYKFPG